MVPWRQSASLLLLGKKQMNNACGKNLFDYSTLFLKRSPNMRFAPDVSAFPGGKLDSCDLSLEWSKYLSPSVNIDRFSRKKADIYKDVDHPYPGLVFRLCAIRETFEETGLLIAKSRSSSKSEYATIMNLSNDILSKWRDRVRQDASQFIAMCKEIEIEPDVNSLFDWSQYLAAAIAKVRFDTIFYIAPLSNTYPCSIAQDDHETVSADWFEPNVAMRKYYEGAINFLPPQIFELSRLGNFRKLSDLIEFLSKCDNHAEHHVQRQLGICYKLQDAVVLVMPGDSNYPSNATFTTPVISSTQTLKDFDSALVQNRLIMMNKGNNQKWQVLYEDKSGNHLDEFYVKALSTGWEKL